METQKQHDTFKFANQLDINNYSAILAVGGDGSFHEVVNGMLMRKDGKRLPVALIPNGSCNVLNMSFGVKQIGAALDFVVKGDTIKMDLMACLYDYERKEDIPEDKLLNHFRYSVICSNFGGIARILHTAIKFKAVPLIDAYLPAGIYHLLKG